MKKSLFMLTILVICVFSVLFFLFKKDVINDTTSNKTVSNNVASEEKPIINPSPIKKEDNFIQNRYHPIIFAVKGEDGSYSSASLVGGSKDGKWVELENLDVRVAGQLLEKDCMNLPGADGESEIIAEIDMVKGGETYRFYSFNQYLTSSEGSKPTIWINGHTLDKLFSVNIKPFKVNHNKEIIIGINGQWNALPRIPKEIGANTIIIDLDNDGENEKIIRREKRNEEEEGITDVFYVVEKQNKKLSLGDNPTQIEGDYVKGSQLYILDLNGDGKMEIIEYISQYYQALTVYELGNNKFKAVLGYYLGD